MTVGSLRADQSCWGWDRGQFIGCESTGVASARRVLEAGGGRGVRPGGVVGRLVGVCAAVACALAVVPVVADAAPSAVYVRLN